MEKTITVRRKSSIQNVRMLTMTAVLSAIAFVLAFLNFLFRCLQPLRVWICRICPH